MQKFLLLTLATTVTIGSLVLTSGCTQKTTSQYDVDVTENASGREVVEKEYKSTEKSTGIATEDVGKDIRHAWETTKEYTSARFEDLQAAFGKGLKEIDTEITKLRSEANVSNGELKQRKERSANEYERQRNGLATDFEKFKAGVGTNWEHASTNAKAGWKDLTGRMDKLWNDIRKERSVQTDKAGVQD